MLVQLLGDVHGKMHVVDRAIYRSEIKIYQLGDFGFGSDWDYATKRYTPEQIQIVPGNHDDYNVLVHSPLSLGNFGLVPGCEKTFFVRGAQSHDQNCRKPGISWWHQEELSFMEGNRMLDMYEELKPDCVLSHDGPLSITEKMFDKSMPSYTSRLLDEMIKIHMPKNHYFGHHHVAKSYKIGDSKFRCLNINERLVVELP